MSGEMVRNEWRNGKSKWGLREEDHNPRLANQKKGQSENESECVNR